MRSTGSVLAAPAQVVQRLPHQRRIRPRSPRRATSQGPHVEVASTRRANDPQSGLYPTVRPFIRRTGLSGTSSTGDTRWSGPKPARRAAQDRPPDRRHVDGSAHGRAPGHALSIIPVHQVAGLAAGEGRAPRVAVIELRVSRGYGYPGALLKSPSSSTGSGTDAISRQFGRLRGLDSCRVWISRCALPNVNARLRRRRRRVVLRVSGRHLPLPPTNSNFGERPPRSSTSACRADHVPIGEAQIERAPLLAVYRHRRPRSSRRRHGNRRCASSSAMRIARSL